MLATLHKIYNAAAGYKGPVKIELLKGTGLLKRSRRQWVESLLIFIPTTIPQQSTPGWRSYMSVLRATMWSKVMAKTNS